MRTVILIVGLAVVMAEGRLPARQLALSPPLRAHDTTQVLVDFQSRVSRYVDLHRQIEATSPPIPISNNWAEITAAIDVLAGRIHAVRASARRGDVFSPEIERWFRHTLATCLEGVSTDAFLAPLEEEEAEDFVLVPRVNGRWPEDAPLTSMPPHLLAVLPPLPDELQYRFMVRDLILWDVHANLIVDFITGALPPTLSTCGRFVSVVDKVEAIAIGTCVPAVRHLSTERPAPLAARSRFSVVDGDRYNT